MSGLMGAAFGAGGALFSDADGGGGGILGLILPDWARAATASSNAVIASVNTGINRTRAMECGFMMLFVRLDTVRFALVS